MSTVLPGAAGPGVEQVEQRVAALADAACGVHDFVGPGQWSEAAAEDAIQTVEITVDALTRSHPDAAELLAPVLHATAELRRRLGLSADGQEVADGASVPELPVAPRGRRRRVLGGLGPGWRGVDRDA
ncbi:hypothetical protein [Streptomyces sp. NPDC087294]|uniref:hypothetical protein n=1 Tax=Streptomyces sp. NPDC087294 TaxID=3365777 RepID=UPI0038063159